jgi:hypothetical protein
MGEFVNKILEKSGVKADTNDTSKPAGAEGTEGTGATGADANISNPDDVEISEEVLLRQLAKKGINVSKVDDLKPKPAEQQQELTDTQKEEARKKKQDNMRAYGLQNGKVSSTELDEFARESAEPKDALALKLYKAERLAEMKEQNVPAEDYPSDQDMEHDFKEQYFLYAAEGDSKRKRAAKELETMSAAYLKARYKNVYGLEHDFDQHETTAVRRVAYNQTISQVVDSLPQQIDIPVKDAETNSTINYPFKVSDAVKQKIRELYSNDSSFSVFGQSALNPDDLSKAMVQNIRESEFQNIVSEIANSHASGLLQKVGKGRRAIPENGGVSLLQPSGNDGEKTVSPTVKKILARKENQLIIQKKK